MKVDKITVCGGGNGAQTLTPIAACNLGCAVDLYAPFGDEAERLRAGLATHGGLEATAHRSGSAHQSGSAVQAKARPRRVAADPAAVIPGSGVVVLVLPAFAHESTLRQIVPFLDEAAWVGAVPARGGFDYCAALVLEEQDRGDVQLFGLQTLPWACRIQDYGQIVRYLGTVDHHPHAFTLDDHHVFPTGKPIPVCGNTASMLSDTRFADHFTVEGDRSVHYGLFDCGSHPTATQEGASAVDGCC